MTVNNYIKVAKDRQILDLYLFDDSSDLARQAAGATAERWSREHRYSHVSIFRPCDLDRRLKYLRVIGEGP